MDYIENTSFFLVYRLLNFAGLEDVSMPFNPTRGPQVASCESGHEDFNLNLINSSNGKEG